MASDLERHFVLHLMNFVYQVSGKHLQYCLERMLSEYPKEREGYFTDNVTKAVLVYIIDYMDSNENLVDIASPAYQTKIEELLNMCTPYEFLKFLSHYAFKSRMEYYQTKILDSPAKFYSSILRLLEEMNKKGMCDVEFWERLDEAAAEVVAKDLEITRARNSIVIDIRDIDMTLESEFILLVTRTIYGVYYKPLPHYLRRKLDDFMISQNEFDPNIDIALNIIKENLEKRVNLLGGDEGIYQYFFNLSTKSFSGRHFLEFCVCSIRRGLFQYYELNDNNAPVIAYERLVSVLKLAKQNGKFKSMQAFTDGANEIIEDDRERRELARAPSDASTEFYSDFSTEPNRVYEKLITSCDRAHKTISSKSIISGGNAQPVAENFIAPIEALKLTTGNLIAAIDALKLTTANVVSSDENDQPAAENVILSGENAKLAAGNVRDSNENPQLSQQNVVATGENVQPEMKSVFVSSENAQPTENIVSAENSQLVPENVITSSESTQQASESENFISSGERTTKDSGHCCTTL